MLLDCIRLAYEINEFGSIVFVSISPHVKLTSFTFHAFGYDKNNKSDYTVNIYEELQFGCYDSDKANNGIDTLEKLHEQLNFIKSYMSMI